MFAEVEIMMKLCVGLKQIVFSCLLSLQP